MRGAINELARQKINLIDVKEQAFQYAKSIEQITNANKFLADSESAENAQKEQNRQEIEAVSLTVLATVLKCKVTADTSRKNTPQWDSLKHIEVIFALEDELGVRFSEEELSHLDSVDSIVDKALTRHAT